MKKQTNLAMTLVFVAAALSGTTSLAQVNGPQFSEEQQSKLNEIQAMLKRLSEAGALESDQDGNIRVNPSILDQLRRSGRVETLSSSQSSICT